MKSFLSKYSRAFEAEILKIIGDYAGFFDLTLRFCVTRRRHLGKIMMVHTNGKTRKLDPTSWGVIHDLKIFNAYHTMLENISRAQCSLAMLGYEGVLHDLHSILVSLESPMKPRYTQDYSLSFPRNGYRGYFRPLNNTVAPQILH